MATHNNHTVSNNYTEDCIKLIQNQTLTIFFFLCINDVDQLPAVIFPFSLSSIITVSSYLQVFSCKWQLRSSCLTIKEMLCFYLQSKLSDRELQLCALHHAFIELQRWARNSTPSAVSFM